MRDINFFRSYQKNKSAKTISFKRQVIGLLAFVVIIVAISGFNYFRMAHIKKNIDEMQAYMTNPENALKYQKYLKEKEKLEIVTTYYNTVSKINTEIENHDHINTKTIDALLLTMPEEIMLQTMEIKDGIIVFQGFSESYTAIAEFEHNLEMSGQFSPAVVSNITNAASKSDLVTTDFYLFSLGCKIKGGDEQ